LRTRLARECSCTHAAAIAAGAVPLGKCTPGRRAEGLQQHSVGLKFCAGVGVDFAVQADFFKARFGPFHDRHPNLKR